MVKLAIGIGSGGGVLPSLFITAGTGPSEETRWVATEPGDARPLSPPSAPRPTFSDGVRARRSAARLGGELGVVVTSGASALAAFASTEGFADRAAVAFERFAPATAARFGCWGADRRRSLAGRR